MHIQNAQSDHESTHKIFNPGILVTGANGFIGSALVRSLSCKGSVRSVNHTSPTNFVETGSIDGSTDWSGSLNQVNTVVHTAARVHIMHDTVKDPLAAFRETNVAGTARLAEAAAAAGVRRFVFLSSVKVNGEFSDADNPFTPHMTPNPQDDYGISKLEAEQLLHEIGRRTGMEIVIIRLPLVYGPGVKGNFSTLAKYLKMRAPLPFKYISNKRSMVGLDNLIDFIEHCIVHPNAAGETFFVSDGEDHSTPEWVRYLAQGLRQQPVLWGIPTKILYFLAAVVRKQHIAQRICGSLQVSIEDARVILNWSPPYSIEDQMAKMSSVTHSNEHKDG